MTSVIMTSAIMTSVIMTSVNYDECHYDECHYDECHYDVCHYGECRGATATNRQHQNRNALEKRKSFVFQRCDGSNFAVDAPVTTRVGDLFLLVF